ncbi:TLC domain-domain-containing protein [Catenaria anguillulae PL171]|uniref:TLC domain-domain-containing protein n=1 Tax=Catenaria anguillulae PL171 TaxID=765915 RepID=A0A1Y2H526_9FUNG|nr:TLC domain-domain-containing protein [Catenaria anguillulae PL171]
MLPPSASASSPPPDLYIPLPVPGPIHALSHALGLTTLPAHWHVLLGSALLCQVLMYLSSQLSPLIAPLTYPRLPKLKRLDWDVHVVSSVHAVAIVLLVWPNLSDPVLLADRVFGYTHRAGTAYAVSCGYFLWDSIFSLVHVREFGVGFLVHGVACLSVYLFSFRPFLLYFGSIFLLYELSTPFLNAHWFMDKTGWAGTKLQLANGLVFLATFFTARIALGFYSSYHFFVAMVHVFDRIPLGLFLLYSVANVILNSLNVYWFMAMIRGLQRRFKSPKPIRASPMASPRKGEFKDKQPTDMMREGSLVVEVTEE